MSSPVTPALPTPSDSVYSYASALLTDTHHYSTNAFESYTSREGADKHTKTENFKVLMDAAEKEGIFGKAPYLVFTKTIGGYDWDRQKV